MMQLDENIKNNIDELTQKAADAAKKFRTYTQEQVDEIVKRVSIKLLPYAMTIAELYQSEFPRGTMEDKYLKMVNTIEVIYNYLRDKKTVGVIKRLDNGIVEVAQPVGVIAGIINCTGVGSVDYDKIISVLKTRNSIVIAPHPATKKTSNFIAKLAHQFAVEAGAPEGCIQCVEKPSISGSQYLMNHPLVRLVWATGGAAMVHAAYSSGKPALGVGPGNVPVYIDEDVDAEMVAESILMSKMIDGATFCSSESNLLVHKGVREKMLKSFDNCGFYILNAEQKQKLLDFMHPEEDGKRHFNGAVVGLEAPTIAKMCGIEVPEHTRLLVVEMENDQIGKKFPFSGEKLSHIVTLYTVDSVKQGIDIAVKTLEYSGAGHTAAVYSNNEAVRMEFAERVPACRLVANCPTNHSVGIDMYNKRIPSYSLGCGRMGKNSNSQNIYYKDLIDIKRYSDRIAADRWYIIPKENYKDKIAVEYLSTLSKKKIFAIIDPGVTKMVEEKLATWLPKDSELFVCNDVEPDPSFEIIDAGFAKINKFQPDIILAIGGGSAIDTAKGVWIRYEHPELELRDFGQPFFDIFKQVNLIPKMGNKAKLVAAPTTCGTGSEMTPFAVFSDTKTHRKHAVSSYEITPTVSLLIPELVQTLPKEIMADTAIDALVHALESFVSPKDCVAADLNSINAVQMIFENLPKAYLEDDANAKTQLLYAANEAGKALANAFVGINHSLAHQIGANFKVPHGKANAIFILPVIRFNTVPVKELFRIPPYPNKMIYDAEARYAELAKKALGIVGSSDKEILDEFCNRIEKLLATLGMEQSISQIENVKVSKEEYEKMVPTMALNSLQDLSSYGNPVYPSYKDMVRLFTAAY